jgi:hypothetical protein
MSCEYGIAWLCDIVPALRGLLTGSNGLWPPEQAKRKWILTKSRRPKTQIVGKSWLCMAVSAGSLVLALVRLLLRAVCRAEEKKRNEETT